LIQHEIRTFKARTGQLFGAITASISKQCADPITDAINRALNQLDLNSIVSDLVKTELKPIQSNINTQQADLENALLKISQVKVPDNFYEDLEMQSKQIDMLVETVERLIELINNLGD
jgi:hypothetical protein